MRQVDTFPTHTIGDLSYRAGRIFPFGATYFDEGINFSIYSKEATACTLLLYHHGERDPYIEIPFPDEFRIGNVFSMMVFGLTLETTEYGYRFDGPYDPKRGLYFDKQKPLLDPYAHSVSGRSKWGVPPDPNNPFQHRGQIILEDYDWDGDKPLELPMKDLVIYEMHIRSFTAHPSAGTRYPGTFAGLIDKIPYLKELGVNCVELMPIFAFDEFENPRTNQGKRLLNYWGYSTVNFFAPKGGYAVGGPFGLETEELKNMIRQLHKNGIEVLLDVVFNHTAEGNENGPYISYRGIDNRTYYLMTPDGNYYNFSGCGNTMNCNNPVVRSSILDCLRYWVSSYHIDGFRFDLAAILSRDEDGAPMLEPPLLDMLAHDAVLGRTKLIAEAWDAGGLYQVGQFPSWNRWSEWNGKYRDCVRRFLRGEPEASIELCRRVNGSPDLYGERLAEASINFVTCHDGFTLYDLVSYNEKHNEANGEEGRDGSNDNLSWNCGVEGETKDEEILSLRMRQIKNAFTILLTCRGIPMFYHGDEFGNTQYGNNNAYCQDNEISWLDWTLTEKNKTLLHFVKNLIAFRKAHPVLRDTSFFDGRNGTDYPELSFHSPVPWQFNQNEPQLALAYLFVEEAKKYHTEEDAFIYVLLNLHWEPHEFSLPIIPAGHRFGLISYSYTGESHSPGEKKPLKEETVTLMPRSTMILLG